MVAQTAATAPKSALLHTPAELTFVTLDETGEIAYFASPSASKPGQRNITAIEIMTLDTFCFCKAAETNRPCWHIAHVVAAWRAVAYRVRCERMDLADLESHRQSLAKYVLDAEAAHQPVQASCPHEIERSPIQGSPYRQDASSSRIRYLTAVSCLYEPRATVTARCPIGVHTPGAAHADHAPRRPIVWVAPGVRLSPSAARLSTRHPPTIHKRPHDWPYTGENLACLSMYC